MGFVIATDMPGGISESPDAIGNENILLLSNANIDDTGWILDERIKYTARTGTASIATANSNLDGTGTVADVITATGYGCLIKRIVIKATGNTTRGMVRIFFKAGGSYWLMREVMVRAVTQSSVDHSFVAEINEPFYLKSGYSLSVSTEKAETFKVMAEGLDRSYPA